ncbi:LacI family DNA-binding transcriptional regulator [Aquincola sp. J276]|uniref:LacI family DNA-binding transcriptional regulator n=1 Tax=Aquincola sp. J276 TaxID=2898432 RepID=UPI0021508258|nr:LacI family DNA-binding transcriptional regulator [Aquincola sp. J276]MCR5868870.1 LacI family DNA-binding transcriptional regulator [Aquincola sp. J276]
MTAPYRRPQRPLPQMADIARLAGVAVSTVSRALAGSPLVNEATRLRVLEIARSLDYTVNVGARNLRRQQNDTVAVIVPRATSTEQSLTDPFFLSLIGSVADALTDQGRDMLLSRIDAQQLQAAAQPYLTGRAMGVIVIGQWNHHDQLNALALRGVPFVVWGTCMPGQAYATVGSDNVEGGRIATAHLLDRGARHIAFVGDTTMHEMAHRHDGWRLAHEARGLQPEPALLRSVPLMRSAITADIDALLASGQPLDAVFASSDLAAITVIGALHRHGLRVPQDVAVVGYDDIVTAAHLQPPLTTVHQPVDEGGRRLVQQLLDQVAGRRPPPVVLPAQLVVRGSSGPVAG